MSALADCRGGSDPCAAGAVATLPNGLADSPASWTWGAVFQSMLAAQDLDTARLVRNPTRWIATPPRLSVVGAELICGVRRLAPGPHEACAPPAPSARIEAVYMPLSCQDSVALTLEGRRPPALRSLTALACGAQPALAIARP